MKRPKLLAVKPLEDHILELTYENKRRKRRFDVTPYIIGPHYGELDDWEYFNRVFVGDYTVEWPNGQDIEPEELYRNSKPVKKPLKKDEKKKDFLIRGNDYEYLKRFQKNHEKCGKGTAFDQFSYTFTPTSLGTAISVKCPCGKKLLIGDFLDATNEYREIEAEDKDNTQFEDAARRILNLKTPRIFRLVFQKEQDFETIYTYAVGVAAFADKRISNCILWKMDREEETGSLKKNYTDDDTRNIEQFYSYFEQKIKEELSKYDCKNDRLEELLNDKHADFPEAYIDKRAKNGDKEKYQEVLTKVPHGKPRNDDI